MKMRGFFSLLPWTLTVKFMKKIKLK